MEYVVMMDMVMVEVAMVDVAIIYVVMVNIEVMLASSHFSDNPAPKAVRMYMQS